MIGVVGSPGNKKKNQKGLLKAEAGELDLIEIHTKHTLKKFQPGKSKGKAKVRGLQTFMVMMETVILQFFVSGYFFLRCNCNFYLCFFFVLPVGVAIRRVRREDKEKQIETCGDQWKTSRVGFAAVLACSCYLIMILHLLSILCQ